MYISTLYAKVKVTNLAHREVYLHYMIPFPFPSKSIFQVPSGRGSCGCKALYDMVPGPERLMKLSR